nr:hypothetical protein [Microctonus hyperodae filamentous virus]
MSRATETALREYNRAVKRKIFNLPINITSSEDAVHVKFVRKNHNIEHEAFDGRVNIKEKGDVLAHATLPPYREICFDADNQWTVDLYLSVLLHELGHILGQHHPNDSTIDSIMNKPIGKKKLTNYDVDKLLIK